MAKKSSSSKRSKARTSRSLKKDKPGPQRVGVDLNSLPKQSDPALQLVWVDMMELMLRGDTQMGTLRFYSLLGDHLSEACRLQVSVAHLKSIIDVLCRNVEYYPSRPRKTTKRA